ncbi:MAG: sugar phosphate nucleotidyltransferase [Thermodesulfovibrionales bacterium]
MLIHAFIPAAGLGERLRPLTNSLPKPLFPILGRPVIQLAYEKISLLEPERIAINTHHLSESISAWATSLRDSRIRLFPEDPILGTGGGLKNVEQYLAAADVLVHNADILTDIDLARLVDAHKASGNIATLAVHDYAKFNTVWVDASGSFVKVGAATPAGHGLCKMAFTGIAVYKPEFFRFLPEGVSSVVDAWHAACAAGRRIGTFDASGCMWNDIGTAGAYAEAVRTALASTGEQVFVHPSIDCSLIDAEGLAVIEKGSLFKGRALVRNSIILPGACIEENALVEDRIVAAAGSSPLELPAAEVPDSPLAREHFEKNEIHALLIGTGGSDRRYYRLTSRDSTCVLMTCLPDDPDFPRQIAFTRFFHEHAFPVAALLGVDHEQGHALFEDLGDTSLYSWLRCGKESDRIERMYELVLSTLATLHTVLTERVAECPGLTERRFDHDLFRWETDYFLEHYLSAACELSALDRQNLVKEFDELADFAGIGPQTIVHRDFQSQNIQITDGQPRIIDFQGARLGPPAYDLASILWDPYHRLDDAMRSRLLEYYFAEAASRSGGRFEEQGFRRSLIFCRLQRHMQALGAYAFLAKVKGKRYFLKHVPAALEYLREEALLAGDSFPTLARLLQQDLRLEGP